MKLIDQTPFFNEKGEISFMDRAKAIMKYGNGWINEIKAQKSVIAVLESQLDKNFTLLCNVTPPGLEASIPLILVGPPGVFVLYVTNMTGMFRAKGDQWGTIVGSTFKPEKPNLLTRTERMARAVQLYLQKQGYSDLTGVEAILLCSEPSIHVDSLRPIIRVVMRDALERFAVSLTQARAALSPEAVHDVINRLQHAPTAPAAAGAAAPSAGGSQTGERQQDSRLSALTASPDSQAADPNREVFIDDSVLAALEPGAAQPGQLAPTVPAGSASAAGRAKPRVRRRSGLSRKQMLLLVGVFVVWCLIAAVFLFLIAQDYFL
jgi:hypothetical protein